MSFLRRLRLRSAFPSHLRGVKPEAGTVAEVPQLSPFVLGRPRSRPPGVRLWCNLLDLNGLAWFSQACCPRRHGRGPHRRPINRRVRVDPEQARSAPPAASARDLAIETADAAYMEITGRFMSSGMAVSRPDMNTIITLEDVLKGRCSE